ncbi:MAG TPA: MFS transporter, partial [Acidimicrobiales bacterium]
VVADRRGGDDEALSLGVTGGEEVVVVPWPLLLRHRVVGRLQDGDRYRWWVLWSALGGLFAVYTVFTLVAVALPRVADEFGTTTSTMTWVVTGPLLVIGVAAPILGKLGDVYGHRRLYLFGLSGSFVFALLSAVAPSAGALIAIRMLAAVSGGALGSASMALIFASFDRHDRVKAMGFWSLVGAGAPVIGVALGGPVVEAVGWRWVFAAQAPLVAVALVVCIAVLPETPRSAARRLDWPGAGLLSAAVAAFLFGLNRGPVLGWTSPVVLGAFAAAPLLAVAFVGVERRAAYPLVPLAYFRRRNFVFPVGALAFSQSAYMGGFILAPLLLAGPLFDYGESTIGYVVLARPLSFSLTAPVAGYLAVRMGERSAAVVGSLAVACSMVVFSTVGAGDLAVVVFALVLSGIGLGISSPSLTSSVANSVADEDLGIAGATQQLVSQVGTVAGIQVMQTILESRQAAVGLAEAFSDAYLAGGVAALLALACAWFVRSAVRDQGTPASAFEASPASLDR